MYGPWQSLTNPYNGSLSIFNTGISADNPVLIYEDGKETRDFVYIEDVIQSICLALENKTPGFNVFNVGSGQNTSVAEVAKILVELMNSQSSIDIVAKFRLGDIRHTCADLRKIKETYGFIPKVSLREGLQSFVEWANKQSSRSDLYENMEKEMTEKGLMGKGQRRIHHRRFQAGILL